MQHYINLFREKLGTDEMHDTPFLDAAHKIVDHIEKLEGKICDRYEPGAVRNVGFSEPCIQCRHNEMSDREMPCSRCNHNLNAFLPQAG